MASQQLAAAIERVEGVLRRRPDMGLQDDAPATARWSGNTRVVIGHPNGAQVSTDMPAELGGTGDQVSPGWLFRAGLASCAATSITMKAASEGIELTALEVRAGSRSDTRGLLGMQDADGIAVSAAPTDLQLHVRIVSPGVPAERLRALVDNSVRGSPLFSALQQALPLAIAMHIDNRLNAMDALSETLRVVHLVGAIFINARFTAPWCYQSPPADMAAPILEPGAERVVIFHLITEGECFVDMGDVEPVRLVAGDAVLFPQGHAHRMCSEPGVPAATKGKPLAEILARRPRQLSYGGGGATTRLVCGYLACSSRLAQMLLAGLPSLVKVSLRGSNAGVWLESSVRYALAEARSPRPGGAGVLAKLSEVLFIEVLRLYMNAQGSNEGRTGWLAGVGDRIVGGALNAMHKKPAHAWTLDELAHEAGTSRSVLAERFQHLVGSSPIQYLTQWRMLLAANMLSRSNAPLISIAQDVGYQTDTAFSRAFRREYGAPPAAWRRSQAGQGQTVQ